jgi:hypothetical protein
VISANVGFGPTVGRNVTFFECDLSVILKWDWLFREYGSYIFLRKWRTDPDIEQESVSYEYLAEYDRDGEKCKAILSRSKFLKVRHVQ